MGACASVLSPKGRPPVGENGSQTAKPAGNAPSGTPASQQLNLNATLCDKEAADAFMAFAREDISEENLEFYLAVADFRSTCEVRGNIQRHSLQLQRHSSSLFVRACVRVCSVRP